MRIDATLPRTRKLAILMAALLAFVWQGVVTQSHVHPEPVAARTIAASAPQAGLHAVDPSAPDTPANCPVCREIAHTGAYLLPTLAMLSAPTHVAVWHFSFPTLGLVRAQRSHAWRSRAPPTLQA